MSELIGHENGPPDGWTNLQFPYTLSFNCHPIFSSVLNPGQASYGFQDSSPTTTVKGLYDAEFLNISWKCKSKMSCIASFLQFREATSPEK